MMKRKKLWKFAKVGSDNCRMFGVNVFDFEWQNEHESVVVEDPEYHVNHTADVYAIAVNGKRRRFAALEVSNCVWAFYLER